MTEPDKSLNEAPQATAATLEDAAAQWFARMRSDVRTAADESALHAWLAEDPRHEIAYRELELLWADANHFGAAPAMQALRAEAKAELDRTAIAHGWSALGRKTRAVRAWRIAAALLAAVGVAALLARGALVQDSTFRTAVGDKKTIQLTDGSEVTLNTDSVIRVTYGLQRREVTLERGQAHFKVAHTVYRPFTVAAGASRIRALGTAFDVQLLEGVVKVTLLEGRVEVSDALTGVKSAPHRPAGKSDVALMARTELAPGQQVLVRPEGIAPVQPANAVKETAWMAGRLIFENERLQDVLTEVNRYSTQRVVVADAALAETLLSGVFRAGRADSFVEALQASFPVDVTQAADGTLILSGKTK